MRCEGRLPLCRALRREQSLQRALPCQLLRERRSVPLQRPLRRQQPPQRALPGRQRRPRRRRCRQGGPRCAAAMLGPLGPLKAAGTARCSQRPGGPKASWLAGWLAGWAAGWLREARGGTAPQWSTQEAPSDMKVCCACQRCVRTAAAGAAPSAWHSKGDMPPRRGQAPPAHLHTRPAAQCLGAHPPSAGVAGNHW